MHFGPPESHPRQMEPQDAERLGHVAISIALDAYSHAIPTM